MPQELMTLERSDYELAADVERSRFLPVMKMEQALDRREVRVEGHHLQPGPGQRLGVVPGPAADLQHFLAGEELALHRIAHQIEEFRLFGADTQDFAQVDAAPIAQLGGLGGDPALLRDRLVQTTSPVMQGLIAPHAAGALAHHAWDNA